jgi:DNA-binding GntR family transcriptional regulator
MTSERRDTADTALRERIASGDLKPGDRLGAGLAAIAAEYAVGKTTMQGILSDLAREGIVRREHGVGYFVAEDGAAIIAEQREAELAAQVRKLRQELADFKAETKADVGKLKAKLAELQSRLNIDLAAKKRERSHEQSG